MLLFDGKISPQPTFLAFAAEMLSAAGATHKTFLNKSYKIPGDNLGKKDKFNLEKKRIL